jgi:hypothetical protein
MSQTTGVVSHGTGAPPPPPAYVDRSMGYLKLFFGVALAGVGGYLFFFNVDRQIQETGGDRGTGAFVGFIIGWGLWLIVNGVIQAKGRPTSWLVGIGVLAVAMVLSSLLVFPKAAQVARVNEERERWDRLQASGKTYKDYQSYLNYNPRPRKGMFAEAAVVGVKEEMAKTGRDAEGRVDRLRSMIAEFGRQMKQHGEPGLNDAIAQAREGLAATYAKAREDLDERLEKMPGKREFPEDQKMRDAFAAVLDRVARQEDNRVYLAFTSDNKIPRTVPAPRGVTDLVQPDDAFSAERNDRRAAAFRSAMEESLRTAFKEPLLQISTLQTGDIASILTTGKTPDDRRGKVVFEVKSVTRQLPGSTFELTRSQKPAGTLFGIDVLWEFAIFDADGKQLVKHTTRSVPAESFKFRFRRDDPTSAAYGYMMDSTYYNFCREVTGRLGLIPPPVKEDF